MPSSAELHCVHPSQAHEFWPHVEKFLKSAVDRCGTWSIGDLRREVDRGALLWIVWDGEAIQSATVTRILHEEKGLVLEAVAHGGEGGHDWRRLYEEIEDYGRNEGCATSRISGRLGWRRVFKDYDLAWVVLEKDLR